GPRVFEYKKGVRAGKRHRGAAPATTTIAAPPRFPRRPPGEGPMTDELAELAKARRHLSRRDAVLNGLLARVGPCTLRPDPDRLGVLVRSIISQQISTKAAISITGRLREALGRRGLRPRSLAQLDDATLRGAGLSAGKVRALRDLSSKILDGV